MPSSRRTITIYDSLETLVEAAAELFVSAAQAAVSEFGQFNVVLAGGSTPRPVYVKLTGDSFRSRIDWKAVHLFWGDERCVPPTHHESNYLMAKTTLSDQVPIPDKNIHRIPGELGAEAAAEGYEKELRSFFRGRKLPVFDLVLLGMGDDGHTASLFPDTAAIHEEKRWAVGHFVDKLDSWRITLTPPALNAAKQIVFLIAGEGKAERLRDVLSGPFQPDHLPAQIIESKTGRMVWMVDQNAASMLSG